MTDPDYGVQEWDSEPTKGYSSGLVTDPDYRVQEWGSEPTKGTGVG